jgi:hypothetical protein
VCKNVGDTILELANSFTVGVKVAGTVPCPVEATVVFKSIIAVNRNEKLDTMVMGLDHKVVESVQDSIIPIIGARALQTFEVVDRRSLRRSGLTFEIDQLPV